MKLEKTAEVQLKGSEADRDQEMETVQIISLFDFTSIFFICRKKIYIIYIYIWSIMVQFINKTFLYFGFNCFI